MAVDDALSDIGAALNAPAAPPAPPQPMPQAQSGIDAALADLSKSPEQLHAEMAARTADAGGGGSGIGGMLANAGRFLGTAAVGAARGTADWLTDPLSPVRRIIDPRLENMEQSIRPHPGEALANSVFAAAPGIEYKPGGALDRTALAATSGAMAGGPFGVAPALLGAASGLLGQGTQELTGSERLATAAGLVPSIAAPLARGAVNFVGGKLRENLGPALSQSYREGLAGEQLRNAATDPEALKSALNIDQVGPIDQGLVPGSSPTLFQLSGDTGIGQLERGLRTQNAAPFLERAAQQNAARVGQIDALAPENAAPSAVRDLLKQHLDALDTEGDANIQRAQQNAQDAFSAVGGTNTPDLYGALMRDQLEAAKTSTKAQESRLWQAIDPGGNLTIDATPTAQAAQQILAEIPRTARPPEGEEAAVMGLARDGGIMPFSDFAALRGRLLQAVRDERANGQTPALRRMQQLRSAMDETISSAADQASQADSGLLGRISGDLSEFGTAAQARTASGGYNGPGASTLSGGYAPAASSSFGAASNSALGPGSTAGRAGVSQPPPKPQDIVEFLTSRGGVRDDGGELRAMDMNRVNGGYGTGGVGQGSFGILSRKNGLSPDTAREYAEEAGYLKPGSTIGDLYDAIHDSSRGIPHYSSNDAGIAADWEQFQKTGEMPPIQPLPQLPANFDADAAGRYRAAANATRERAQTYNNQIVGPALQERGTEYRMLDSRVPEQFLRSPEGVQAFLSAGGDVATLRDALAADLRRSAANTDGTLSPQKFASWRTRRADSLRAFPELDQALGNAANAQQTVDAVSAGARQQSLDFQKGAARHFLNAEPDKAVQAAFASKNPVADFRDLARLVSSDSDAKAGLQRAVADYMSRQFVGNTEAGTSGLGAMKSDVFQTFVRRNWPALSQILSPQQMQAMRAVAADLQRSNRSLASSKIPGQSNTAQDMSLQGSPPSLLRQHLADAALSGGGGIAGFLLGGAPGAAVGGGLGVAKAALSRMKAAGIESTNQLVTEALLNPELARTLLLKPNPASRPFIARSLRSAFGRIAAASASRQGSDQNQ